MGGGGGAPEGLRVPGGGGILTPPGGGGGARGGGTSGAPLAEVVEIVDDGLGAGRGGTFFRLAINGLRAIAGDDSEEGGGGGRAPGGRGAEGGLGAGAVGGRVLSPSDMYDESRLAPVSTPPRLRSFGIPPAKRPPNCAAGPLAPPSDPDTPSLLLRNRFAAGPDGTGGASPEGAFIPGTGGAPPIGGAAEPPPELASCGPDRSLVTAFFNRVPLWMSDSNAPYPLVSLFLPESQAPR